MKTKKILFSALAICFVFVTLSSCKNKKQTGEKIYVTEETPTPPPPISTPDMSTSTPDAPKETPVLIEYRRGACYGTCPIFNLTVYADGKAVYEGKNFVDMIGTYTATISRADIDHIVTTAENIDFFSMKDVYDNEGVTDLPSVLTGIAKNGELKTVRNRYQGPPILKKLYEELEALIKKQSWKLIKKED